MHFGREGRHGRREEARFGEGEEGRAGDLLPGSGPGGDELRVQ